MMARTALDTSVVIAALLGWHADHGRAHRAVADVLGGGERPVLPVPALVEAYSDDEAPSGPADAERNRSVRMDIGGLIPGKLAGESSPVIYEDILNLV